MKYLFISFILFFFLKSEAQTATVNQDQKASRTGLSEKEMEVAKADYLKMMGSETYVLLKKATYALRQKLNGVDIFPTVDNYKTVHDEIVSDGSVENFYKKKLAENLKKTKFKSVEEGMAAIRETMDLMGKKLKENEELYALMKKATPKQLREIKAPETEMLLNGH